MLSNTKAQNLVAVQKGICWLQFPSLFETANTVSSSPSRDEADAVAAQSGGTIFGGSASLGPPELGPLTGAVSFQEQHKNVGR